MYSTIVVGTDGSATAAKRSGPCGRTGRKQTGATVHVVHAYPMPDTAIRAGRDNPEVLIDAAERLSADLMVIGNRGMSGVRRFVLGSVLIKVSHHCPCHLLILQTG